jgi:hypothetical protein
MRARLLLAGAVLPLVLIASAQVQLPTRSTSRPYGPMSRSAATKAVEKVMADLQGRKRYAAMVIPLRPDILRKVLTADTSALNSYLASNDAPLVREAINEAGGRKKPAFVRALAAIASKPKGSIAAVHALASIGDPTAKAALRNIAKQPNQPARIQAAMHLAEQGDPIGKPALLEGLHTKLLFIYNPNGTPAQREAAECSQYFRDKYRIAHDLIALGYGHTKKELDDLLEGAANDRRRILPELAAKPWPHVKPALIRILGDQKEYHGNRKWAAIALGQSRYRPAVPALIVALNDPVRGVRIEVIKALVEIGDKRAIKALDSAIDVDPPVLGDRFTPRGKPTWMSAKEAADILRRNGH